MMVPLLKKHVTFEEKKDETPAYLIVERTNWAERMSVKFLRQPSVRRIKLDENGEFVIRQMLMQKTVTDIAGEITAHFGEEAEPVLPRLVKFLEILEQQEWIYWME